MAYPQVAVVLGAQWGDEGKGKLTDILSGKYDVCARYNGGSNAGHTIVKNGTKYATHLLPSGILTDQMVSVIGNGVVIHFPTLFSELQKLEAGGIKAISATGEKRLLISDRAHVVFEFHRAVDGASEVALGTEALGTTGRGIGPTYMQKCERTGIRVHNLFEADFAQHYDKALKGWLGRYPNVQAKVGEEVVKYPEYSEREIKIYLEDLKSKISPFVIDTVDFLDTQLRAGKKLLIESANAIMLDIDHGTYPFVTSSSPSVGGACTGLGVPISRMTGALVVGIVKAYTTRVGSGPFPSELSITEPGPGKVFSEVGAERGTTTGRFRRCGWLDLAIVSYGHKINGYTCLNLTKLDVLDTLEEIKVCTHYSLNGKKITTVPASLTDLAKVECQYTSFPGWKKSIAGCKSFGELPKEAQDYVKFIEKEVGVPVRWIGTGPAADQMIEVLPK